MLNAKVRLRPWPNAAKAQRKQRKAKCAEFGFNALQIHSFGIVPTDSDERISVSGLT